MKCDSEYHFFILVSSVRTSSCDAQSPFKTMKWVVQVAELLQRAYCGTEHITLSQPSLSPAILLQEGRVGLTCLGKLYWLRSALCKQHSKDFSLTTMRGTTQVSGTLISWKWHGSLESTSILEWKDLYSPNLSEVVNLSLSAPFLRPWLLIGITQCLKTRQQNWNFYLNFDLRKRTYLNILTIAEQIEKAEFPRTRG